MKELDEYEKGGESRQHCTESYFSAMRRRLNLQMISTYIRDGGQKIAISNKSFRQREKEAYSAMEKLINKRCGESAEMVMEQLNAYSSVLEEIYFNLGMKAGVILHGKLTDNFETDI